MVAIVSLTVALSLASPAIDGATAERGYILRAEASAADAACSLFTQSEKRVLAAGLRQAHADLIAAGASGRAIASARGRINADATLRDCASARVASIADKVKQAHQLYMSQRRWELPGRALSWRADRGGGAPGAWPIRQDLSAHAVFGWASLESGGALVLAARSPNRPTTALITLRDASAAEPVDATAGGLLAPPNGEPLAAFGPPPWAQKRVFASQRLSPGQASLLAPTLDGDDAPGAIAFSFPASALEALVELDPREGVRIDLINGDGAPVQTWWMEVGGLRAAVDFIAAYDAQMAAPLPASTSR